MHGGGPLWGTHMAAIKVSTRNEAFKSTFLVSRIIHREKRFVDLYLKVEVYRKNSFAAVTCWFSDQYTSTRE